MASSANVKNASHSFRNRKPGDWEFIDFLGVSPGAQEVRRQLELIASDRQGLSVLITGERGTGKDLAANIIQSRSVYVTDKSVMVHQDCGTLHINNAQSQLFGHCKGAFTGADTSRKGCFLSAQNGAVFLNEIGNIPYEIQPMLLRVVEYGVIVPMGVDKEEKINALMIFATNCDIDKMCCENLFKKDLLDRMKRRHLHIPPLRERREDIPVLTEFLFAKKCHESGTGLKTTIDKGVYSLLACCELKGNVRELDNLLTVAFDKMLRNDKNILMPEHLMPEIENAATEGERGDLSENRINECFEELLKMYLEQQRKSQKGIKTKDAPCLFGMKNHTEMIKRIALEFAGHQKSLASKYLDISVRQYDNKP